jgi:hypothetical protein
MLYMYNVDSRDTVTVSGTLYVKINASAILEQLGLAVA